MEAKQTEHRRQRARSSGARQRTRPPKGQLGRIPTNAAGSLIIIGGNENKEGHRPILEEIARRANGGKLVVATLASEEPDEQWQEYHKLFRDLGVRRVEQLDVRERR